MNTPDSFVEAERELVAVAIDVLEQFRPRLLAASRRFTGPEVEVNTPESATYSSELRIVFYKDGDVDDVLEFFLFRNGLRVVTGHDVEAWLTDQLEEMLSS
jgi:hypothetical protein